jgi:hypothetical protein
VPQGLIKTQVFTPSTEKCKSYDSEHEVETTVYPNLFIWQKSSDSFAKVGFLFVLPIGELIRRR